MEATYQTKAIILSRQPFRENDCRVIVYSRDRGKIDLVARGTKKISSKLAGHLEPFNLSDLMVARGRQYDYIGAAISQNCHYNIKTDLEKLFFAAQAVAIFNKSVKPGEKGEKLFELLQDFLETLNENKLSVIRYQLFYHFFTLNMLAELGYRPELHNCVICGNKILPAGNQFNLSKGGLVCASCQKNNKNKHVLPISADCIKVLRLAVESDLNKLIKLKINDKLIKEINDIICSFYNFIYC
ncbi:DNA repair protein RecO [Patescibacteria group bacterium]|nr:DNA repair protein RecO [Patescibacteria group bacterium]MBU4346966.1 DNA repair protein RecO [Patescibacteria group bacterium]MBU4455519.1 DNA repair protein RecO [Patescibacteria group bacterium]MCG2691175.1 DNA repair protein RecO [Candidatus Parcubacteria bacterium]